MNALRALVGLVATLMMITGCSVGGSSVASPKREEATEPSRAAKAALRDPQSPASTVARFWRYVAAGALPAALPLYDERITLAVGPATFGGTFDAQQETAATTKLNIVEVESIGRGALVFAELIPTAGAKSQTSFFLRRQQGRWRIVYDTFSARALTAFVQQQEQRRIDPYAKRASPRALRAADGAAARFRAAALSSKAGSR
jgi:hypothetical protein